MNQNIRNGNKIIRRAMAAAIAVLLVLLIAFSLFFIAHEADHDCTGHDCPVCALIMQCENNIRTVGSGTAAAFICGIIMLMLAEIIPPATSGIILPTPVTNRTRLNY